MKDELGCKTMKEFIGLRAKSYIFWVDDGSEEKKQKALKKVSHKKN